MSYQTGQPWRKVGIGTNTPTERLDFGSNGIIRGSNGMQSDLSIG